VKGIKNGVMFQPALQKFVERHMLKIVTKPLKSQFRVRFFYFPSFVVIVVVVVVVVVVCVFLTVFLVFHLFTILNQIYSGTTGQTVVVTCVAGFTGGGVAECGTNGQFNMLKCTGNTCTPAGDIADSNKATSGSITGTTGQTVVVTCDAGFTGGGVAECGTNGQFNMLKCTANTCTAAGNVANSDKAEIGSIVGKTHETVAVTCFAGFGGSGVVMCQTNGSFDNVPACVACETGKYNDQTDQPLCKDDCDAGSYISENKNSCNAW